MTTESKQSAMNIEEKQIVYFHEEGQVQDTLKTGYTGDHVTGISHSSPVERSLFWKIGPLFVTIASLVYFVSYLDRNSVGNAQVAGLSKSLKFSADQYVTLASMFFVGYILMMYFANIILRVLPPRFVVGGACVTFGALVAGMGGVHHYATIIVLRIFVGCSQAMIQGVTIYASLWFRRDEMATVGSIYYSAATISGAFSGLISYGAVRNLTEAKTGLEPWRWIFVIDGAVAIFVGILTIILLPGFPDTLRKKAKHWLFTADELEVACQRTASFNTLDSTIKWSQTLAALKDPKSWGFVLIQFGIAPGIGVVGSFLPTLIQGFGLSTLNTQLFSTIPYAVAFISLIAINYLSDRINQKGIFLMGTLSSAIIGFILLLTDASKPVKIFATCLITGGLYPSVLLSMTWISINTTGFTKRGSTWAMAEISGQCMTIGATHAYNKPPRQTQGHSLVLALMVLALISVISLRWWLNRCNAEKDRIEEEYQARGERHPHQFKSLEDENDQHQYFRYIL